MPIAPENLVSELLDLTWPKIRMVNRYSNPRARLPQKADIRFEPRAGPQSGITVASRPRRTYRGNPGECGIPSREWTAQKAAESSQ